MRIGNMSDKKVYSWKRKRGNKVRTNIRKQGDVGTKSVGVTECGIQMLNRCSIWKRILVEMRVRHLLLQ